MHMEVKVTMTGVKIKGSQDNPCEVQAKRGQNRGVTSSPINQGSLGRIR